jgi:two-component system CheB/CheR fusion protein
LVVEDDPGLRELLELILRDESHHAATARDGAAALEFVARGAFRPDLILADYDLPGVNGLQLIARLRENLHRQIPAIILTGDISTRTSRDIARQNCVRLIKPVSLSKLTQTIQRLLPTPHSASTAAAGIPAEVASPSGATVIFIVDDDSHVREHMRAVLEDAGWTAEAYSTCEAFLEAYRPGSEACLVIDAYLPGMNGLGLLHHLRAANHRLPAIMITGYSDVPMAVQAMKAGALDFIEKPVGNAELLASIERALEQSRDATKLSAWRADAANHIAALTSRQRQVLDLVLAGHPSKNIAVDLCISQRTVETHRGAIMRKTGTKSVAALARLALAAEHGGDESPVQRVTQSAIPA